MNPMDTAWRVLKAPFESPDDPVGGPIYSGGDIGDDPKYWTADKREALDYALFGSAVLESNKPGNPFGYDRNYYPNEQPESFTGIPPRQTVPTIRRVNDPGPIGTHDLALNIDPESPHTYTAPNLHHETMDNAEVEQMIDEYIHYLRTYEEPEGWEHDSYPTTGLYLRDEEKLQHLLEAKKRLRSGEPGDLSLPESIRDKLVWSETFDENRKDMEYGDEV